MPYRLATTHYFGLQMLSVGSTIISINLYFIPLQKKIVPAGIRTPDPRLRRAMLYPAELLAHKRMKGIEPS